ncbi:uncharacterized protein LOC125818374 [Solanum verrucosum]|uniref:uncharacterized protein LOC125818374 n=1 Tax=Solanum verrucosum TaxID=315347 RepID=UPI0020D1934C|nr:uncharacterized protein LOC125818374 [Solanum verrucosum]
MQAKEEEWREDVSLVQQGQVLVLLEHQLNHNQAQREEEVDQEVLQNRLVLLEGEEELQLVMEQGLVLLLIVLKGTGVAVIATDVPGATGGGKRPRMVGMGILHTQSGFTIHNPGMPMNSSIVTGNLGHHKPRSGLKWKGKAAVTQQGLQEMRENKRMRTRSNAAEL